MQEKHKQAERVVPHPNVPAEQLHKAGTIINWSGDFPAHYGEYLVNLPGLVGNRGYENIPKEVVRDIETRLPEGWHLYDRGVRLEIVGQDPDTGEDFYRDDEVVKHAVLDYMDELNQFGNEDGK